jgi:hypothetical protein
MRGPEGVPAGFWDGLARPFEDPPFPFHVLDLRLDLNIPPSLGERVRSRLALQDAGVPDPRVRPVRVFPSPKPQFKARLGIPEEYRIDFTEKGEYLSFYAYYAAARLHIPTGRAVAALAVEAGDHLPGEVENLLRVLSSALLVGDEAFLLHSSAVVTPEGAMVFVGHSGAGKSTSALMFQEAGYPVLSDDLNILCRRSGRWKVQASPFLSEVKRVLPGRHPIRALHFLLQDRENRLEVPSAAARRAYIYSNLVVVNGIPGLAPRIFTLLEDLDRSVPIRALHFKKDKELVPWLLSR